MSTNHHEARAALARAEIRLTPEERRRRRKAGKARMAAIGAAGSYRLSLRDARGDDVPERR